MFSDNKKSKMATESISTQNIIAADTKIVGDIVSKGPFRIDGQVEGNIKTRDKIVVGKSGFVNGTIDGTNADFEGSFSGKLKLSGTLSLKSSAYVQGEVEVGKLAVEPGATFNATCSMKGAVKELNKGGQQQSNSEKERTA
ncbi:polymer-forming cytoskeletal protein [Flavobacteriaceae bacterium]|jgi:cytoskeletal protein CcmA (bactofilin family)|nr:polymer-forming cytoskeletal protein [Bacteroidota bacterium]MDA9552223.1 polymer-forming cytoskeletal protein [Flavobacteriaceae bacterium]MDB2471556.1 polymer-forming cytoskeletal protein [Flavobacteriaceae bacterium]MDB2612297.1 polymer-forming cytoskeletal protein [Flavobacteriaceae bacterium]MDC1051610.1 polymer-forming cytoskeletal protein [Flavobacteriaceae bacterium]|tara:strand:+ start:3877 stop:4299 length:423 start_codon:yes stop_codon:yes gene_type:complete